ncbi:hypothetical protein F5Y14DRAFT_435346, partial [Nemania sp. NC0429]
GSVFLLLEVLTYIQIYLGLGICIKVGTYSYIFMHLAIYIWNSTWVVSWRPLLTYQLAFSHLIPQFLNKASLFSDSCISRQVVKHYDATACSLPRRAGMAISVLLRQ